MIAPSIIQMRQESKFLFSIEHPAMDIAADCGVAPIPITVISYRVRTWRRTGVHMVV